jgi:hypothetical protein
LSFGAARDSAPAKEKNLKKLTIRLVILKKSINEQQSEEEREEAFDATFLSTKNSCLATNEQAFTAQGFTNIIIEKENGVPPSTLYRKRKKKRNAGNVASTNAHCTLCCTLELKAEPTNAACKKNKKNGMVSGENMARVIGEMTTDPEELITRTWDCIST